MSGKDKQSVLTSIQLPSEVVDRIDALIDPMDLDARAMGASVTRASVIRAAIIRGLGELETKYLGGSKEPQRPWEKGNE
jgi:hypothetical protein